MNDNENRPPEKVCQTTLDALANLRKKQEEGDATRNEWLDLTHTVQDQIRRTQFDISSSDAFQSLMDPVKQQFTALTDAIKEYAHQIYTRIQNDQVVFKPHVFDYDEIKTLMEFYKIMLEMQAHYCVEKPAKAA